MTPVTHPTMLRYGLAFLVMAIALLLTLLLQPISEQIVFVLFFTAVTVSAWYGGLGPGLLTTLLSVMVIDLFLENPPGKLKLDWDDISRMTVFVVMAIVISSLNEARKRTTDSLRETNQTLNTLIQSSPLAIIVLDSEGRVKMWSPASKRIFGWSEHEVLGQSLPTIPPDQQEEFRASLEAIRHGEEFNGSETRCRRKDGVLIQCSVWASLLPGERDESAAFLWVADDITERKAAEKALRSLTEALKRSDELKSALLASVSHDLRTPLTSIRAAIDNLLQKDFKWDQAMVRELHLIISEEVSRLTRLIENLLEMARIEARELRLSRQWGAVPEICSNVLDRCAASLNNHRMITKGVDAIPLIKIDSRLVAQALANLVENAAKYSPHGSEITLEARLEDGRLLMSVTDEGPGIAAEDLDRIFEKFYRSTHRAKQQKSGTGMGLAIARGIIEAHGGRIWVESISGKGATFIFEVPVEHKEASTSLMTGGE